MAAPNLSVKMENGDSLHSTRPCAVSSKIDLLLESVSSKNFLVFGESHQELAAREVGTALAVDSKSGEGSVARGKVVALRVPQVGDTNIAALLAELRVVIQNYKFRQFSIVSFGATNALALALYLEDPKLIRTLVLINATTRPHPTRGARIVDKIEQLLPLGLPLRLKVAGFDAKPYLQRVRCPVLVVTTPEASQYELSEAGELTKRLPTAWRLHAADEAQLVGAITEFQEVPAKCPQ